MLRPVPLTGLDYTKEHPASSRRVATVHRTVTHLDGVRPYCGVKESAPNGCSRTVPLTGLDYIKV